MEHALRILHISDLHLRGAREQDAWHRRRVLGDAWRRNLEDLRRLGRVDLVAFTGDLAFSGRASEYDGVLDFLEETLTHLECPWERLFLVPGNHDVDRAVATPAWAELRARLGPGDAEALSRWMASESDAAPLGLRDSLRDEVLARQGAYRSWVARRLGRTALLPSASLHPRLGYRETLRLPELPFEVHVIGLDSAWLAGDAGDAGRLWLTDDQVRRLTTDAAGRALGGLRLALMHHPLEVLADGDRARGLLEGHADLLLRGHLHAAKALPLDASSSLRCIAAGGLYGSERYPSSCQLLQLSLDDQGRPESCQVWFRAWSSRGHWHRADTLVPGRLGRSSTRPGAELERAVARAQEAERLHGSGELDAALRIRVDEVLPTFERLGAEREYTHTLTRVTDILRARGELDEALRLLREQVLPVYARREAEREHAFVLGRMAHILQEKGELDEALRIHRDEELPVYARLGAVHEHTFTLAQMANVLQEKGELDEALRLRRERVLPAFKRLGAVREHSIALAKVADILQEKGELAEALRIHREEILPHLRGPEDAFDRALIQGKVAEILQDQFEFDEALRLQRDEVLPIYERLGAELQHARTLGRVATLLEIRGKFPEALRLRRERELPAYARLGAEREHAHALARVADILFHQDEEESLRIRREELLPAFERLGEELQLTLTLANVGEVLWRRGELGEARAALERALKGARRLMGSEHPYTLHQTRQLAALLNDSGEPAKALVLLERLVDTLRRTQGTTGVETQSAERQREAALARLGPRGRRLRPEA